MRRNSLEGGDDPVAEIQRLSRQMEKKPPKEWGLLSGSGRRGHGK